MREQHFHYIPAVARRIALDELTIVEAELAEEKAAATELVKQLTSAGEEVDTLRKGQMGRTVEVQTLTASLERVSAEAEDLRATLAERESAVRAAEAMRTELEARLAELTAAQATTRAQLEARSRQLEEAERAAEDCRTSDDEIATCRALADKCVFVMGFARSNTTITLGMLNCAANSLILGEANFFLGSTDDRFSDSYNKQHCEFQNQITKSSHAPDFLPGRPHSWWQWLESAGQFYDCIGDKLALSDFHFSKVSPDAFLAFHEARFLTSRYIFMLRNPVDALLSSARLNRIDDDAGMVRLCAAWLDFMQLWADFVRVFPRTMTVVSERFGEAIVNDLEAFTGLDLGDARLLIDPANKRHHKLTGKFPTLVRLKPQLEELYGEAMIASEENRALWQAEQKRSAIANEPDALGSVAVAPRPLGRVWLRVQELRETLGQAPNRSAL